MENEIIQSYIKELRQGSHRAFNAIYDLYADKVFSFVYSHTKSSQLSEDIVQETFLRLWQNREKIGFDGSLQSLLFTISKHKIIDVFRKQINKSEFSLFVEYLDEQTYTENEIEKKMSFDEFNNALKISKKLLSERQLEIFELNKEKGKTIKEIASKLDLSEQTVKNQLSISLKKIRLEIEKHYQVFLILLFILF
jgi:RNA polymerase sigma-70 factor (ECF subfamily)